MEIAITIFVRRHQNQTYTVTVPSAPGITAFGPTLEECKGEITLALMQRLADMDPAHVNDLAATPGTQLFKTQVELFPRYPDGRRRRNSFHLLVSLILIPADGQFMVQAPLLTMQPYNQPLVFFSRPEDDLEELAKAEISEYFGGAPLEVLQNFQGMRYENIETLTVEFTPKSPIQSDKDRKEMEEADFWALRSSGVNLTAQAKEKQLGRAYRREPVVEEVLRILAGDSRPSLILLGDSGVGKTAIVHEVARRIQRKECPETLHDRELWSVTGSSLLAGMQFIGQWQEKLTNLVHEVRKKRHILFVEDIAGLADAGRWSKSDENMASFLKPYIQTGDVVIIGESTPHRLRYTDRLTPGFVSQFRTVPVEATSTSDTLAVLATVVHRLEKESNVRLQPSALEAAVELTTRYLPYRALPGKAISLVEQAVGDVDGQRGVNDKRLTIDRRHVVASFTRQTGLPEFLLSDAAPLDITAVRSYFAERVIGQDAAVDAMTDLVAVIKAGLNDPHKPLGSFLFIGPTGVGKTEMAKTLASYLFGDEKRLLRFDMSEYMDPAGVRRLIGMPGSDSEGELTGRVRAQPFCVLLLDEFEKADPQIYDLFLQVMGEGRLTDATGQTTSFQNAVVLLTSNLGSGAREQRGLGLAASNRAAGASDDPSYWRSKIEQYFRPEFINRIDQVVVFQPLSPEVMRQIARRELGHVLMREGLVRRNVLAEVDDNVIDLLVEQGFDAAYGARPLKRAIERLVVVPLARFLAGRPDGGGDLLRLRRAGDQVTLSAIQLSNADRTATVELGASPLEADGKRRRLTDRELVEGFASLRLKLQVWSERPDVLRYEDERSQALAAMNKPSFWDNTYGAQETVEKFYRLDRVLKRLRQLTERAEYLEELAGLVRRERDSSYRGDLADGLARLERDAAYLEIELMSAGSVAGKYAMLILRVVGQRHEEDAQALIQLAQMYARWGQRKGYEISMARLDPLELTEARMREARERVARMAADYDPDDFEDLSDLPDIELVSCSDVTAAYFPYRWYSLSAGDDDNKIKQLAGQGDARELAVLLEGVNVRGFVTGEQGLHRFNEKRPSGERSQTLVEVVVEWFGPQWIDREPCYRAMRSPDYIRLFLPDYAPPAGQADLEVARVYQLGGQGHVLDPRTRVRRNDVQAVLDGDLDDFILAFLRVQQELLS
ncbi:MAG: AAA family ATPase [Caldilineales bacterium]